MRLLAALSLASSLLFAGQQAQPDFRRATWGMSQAEVMATEAARPVEVRQDNGEAVLKYEPVDAELSGRLIYIFAEDKLVRAKYVSNARHTEPTDFIVDYRAVEPLLLERYGKPSNERAVWENDLGQQERLPYLDQDRALTSDVLPSDTNAGLSVSLGYLRLITQRTGARTRIVHALTGEDSRVTHQIEYRSLEFEALEKKVLRENSR